jgi:two-component system sensor histidine kinase PilS (NtrC family)
MSQEPIADEGAVSAADLTAREQLVRLLFAHLSLTVLAFGIAVALDGLGRELPTGARHGLYVTVAAAFATTVVSGLALARARLLRHFVTVQLATDVAIVTALVHYSGGRESIFTFLYVVVTLYGAVLFQRRGAMIGASLSAAAYGGLLFATRAGLIDGWGDEGGGVLPVAALVAIWAVHVGALYLVGVLASLLSSELQRTGRALDQSTHDLRQLRDLHQRTVESLMSGLMTLDAGGLITSFNPEAERITGLSSAMALGRSVDRVIPGAIELIRQYERPSGRPALPRGRLRFRNTQGRELHLGVAASILRSDDDGPHGHVVIFQDVTDVVAMERELRSSERLAAVGEMAAKIAHEIRNPLASISGSIQILRAKSGDETASDRDSGRLMDIVVRETDRLNGLITDFLMYSRPSPPSIKRIAARAVLCEVAELLEGMRPENIEIVVAAPAELCVEADPDQLRQVIWNLAVNGLEAMPLGGRLVLDAHQEGGGDPAQAAAPPSRNEVRRAVRDGSVRVAVGVSDTGEGMSPAVQERMFEPFFTTKRAGTGLGLATVYRIAEGHGGSVEIDSELGAGTRIRVWLPGVQEQR